MKTLDKDLVKIQIKEAQVLAEQETRKNKAIKARKFDSVKIDQTVTFEEKGMIESGIVCDVKENTFTLIALRSYNKFGVMSYHNAYFHFLKTGTKSNRHYTYGNAIAITCRAI